MPRHVKALLIGPEFEVMKPISNMNGCLFECFQKYRLFLALFWLIANKKEKKMCRIFPISCIYFLKLYMWIEDLYTSNYKNRFS